MDFNTAAELQYRGKTYYTVWLVSAGYREQLGYTSRKTGYGLMAFLDDEKIVRRLLKFIPEGTVFEKTGKSIELVGTGYRLEFGETIRQEARK